MKRKTVGIAIAGLFIVYLTSFRLLMQLSPVLAGGVPLLLIGIAGAALGLKRGLGFAVTITVFMWLFYLSLVNSQLNYFLLFSVLNIIAGLTGGYFEILQKDKKNYIDKIERSANELADVKGLLETEKRAREITENKLNARLKYETLISDTSLKFAGTQNIDEIDTLINSTIKEITEIIECDRGYIYIQESDSVLVRKYYYHSGALSSNFSKPMIDISGYETLADYFLKEDGMVVSTNVENPGFSKEINGFMQAAGANIIAASPIRYKDKAIGFIGFDRVKKSEITIQEDLTSIGIIKKIIEEAISRKLFLEELAANKKHFETLSNSVIDFAFKINVVDNKTSGVEWINDSFFVKTGYKREDEKTIENWESVIYPEDVPELNRCLDNAIQKQMGNTEIRIITSSGSTRYIRLIIEPELDKNGNVIKIAGGAQDITLQKAYENTIRQKEEKFRLIFDLNPFPMLLVDPDNLNLLECNNAAIGQYGYPKEELLKLNYLDLYFEKNSAENLNDLGREYINFLQKSVSHKTKAEKKLQIELYSSQMIFSGKKVYLVIPLDITEKTAITNENKLLAHSIKSIQECVSITNEKNELLYVNDAFCKAYGYSSEELIGKNIRIMHGLSVPEDYSDKVAVKTILEGYKGEFLNRRKNGEEFPINLTTSNVTDENGNILALIGVATDITERKKNEAALLEAVNSAKLEKLKTETIIKSIGEAVRIIDNKFNITYQNDICEGHFSIGKGKPCYSIFNNKKPCEDCPLFINGWEGNILHKEKVISDGSSVRYFDLTISAIKDREGKIMDVIELAKETTTQKEIENSLKDKVSQMELIGGLMFGFKDIFNIKSLIKYIYEVFPKYIPKVDAMSVLLYDEGNDELFGAKSLLSDDPEYRKKTTSKINFTNLAGRCFMESKPVYIADCKTAVMEAKAYFIEKKIVSTVFVPLIIKQKKIGVIRFDNKSKVNTFSHNDIEYFEVIAEQLAMLIHNDKLIEEIKKSERDLTENKEYLNDMVNALRVGVIAIDARTHTVIDINKYALELIGMPRELLIGKFCHKFICPAEVNKCPVTDLDMEVDSSERILLNYKNEKIPVLKSVVPIISKGRKILIESFIDITNIKKIENELRESEETLSAIFRNMHDAVMFIDNEMRVLNVTPSIEEVTGCTVNSLVNKNLKETQLVGNDSYAVFEQYINDLFNSREADRQIIDTRVLNNSAKKVEISGSLCYLNGKKYVVLALRDITAKIFAEQALKEYNAELLKLNEKLLKSQDDLKTINANKDKFFSIIAHDLRSPFNALLGFSDFLVNDNETLSQEEVKTFAGHINVSAKQLFNLLENLLQWSRIQTGRLEYKPKALELSSLVKNVFNLLNANAIRKNILLSLEAENDISIYADKNAISSVFQNLISNAIKFTNKGGFISVKALVKNGNAEIEVKDTGIGMSEESISKLFKIEVQHSTAGTDNEQGSGLGLILCKELIEKNKGTIRVESEPGHGTSFVFTLPIAE
jgi:PAS domain S-box-containing protein